MSRRKKRREQKPPQGGAQVEFAQGAAGEQQRTIHAKGADEFYDESRLPGPPANGRDDYMGGSGRRREE